MKIVYMIEDFSIKGGAERIISEKANYLASFHHEITIISVYHDEKPMSYKLNKGVNFISLQKLSKKTSCLKRFDTSK